MSTFCSLAQIYLNGTMEGGALFKVRSEAKERVLAAFPAINIRKNEVDDYAYNDANTLVTEIE